MASLSSFSGMGGLLPGAGTARWMAREMQQRERDSQQQYDFNKQANPLTLRLMDLQSQDTEEAVKLRRTQREQLLQQMAREEDERNLMQRISASQSRMSLPEEDASAEDLIASFAQKAGMSLLGINPKKGMEMLGEASRIRTNAGQQQLNALRTREAQAEMSGQVFEGISDQESLNEAIPMLAQMGVEIPKRFREFSPEAEQFFKRKALASKTVRDSLRIQNDATRIEQADQRMQNLESQRERENALKQQEEARKRERWESNKRTVRLPKDELARNVLNLRQSSPDFDGLSLEDQRWAGTDFSYRVASYMANGQAKDQVEAEALARKDIESRIDPETGEYMGFKEAGNGQAPTLEEWLEKAQKANPKASKEQLTSFYNQKYGSQ